jgi:AcrR family transcriptional regulator
MSTTERPLRADAERNRNRIVEAARVVFAREGLHAGVDAIAREAGVGIGTLYRRFPHKADLIKAIVRDMSEEKLEAIEAIDDADPWAALTATLRVFAEQIASNRTLFGVLRAELPDLPVLTDLRARLIAVFEPRLRAAQAAGIVRDDVSVTDLLPVVAAVARIDPTKPGVDPAIWQRYLALVFDGLRAEGATPLPGTPPPRVLE